MVRCVSCILIIQPTEDGNGDSKEKVTPEVANQEEEVEEEEELVFEYDYDEMKSGPVMVNSTTSEMLKLQYPNTFRCLQKQMER